MTRDYQADPLTGRPVSWRIAALDEPEPVRHGDAERRRPFAPVAPGCAPCSRSFRLRWGFAWTTRTGSDTKSPKWRINSLTRIRCRTQTSAGRHGMPATHTAVSYTNTTSRWSSPTGRRSAGSGIWWCGTCSWPPTTSTTRAVGERPQRDTERRRFDHGRYLSWHDSTPEFCYHTGLSAGQSRLQVVPRRRGTRPTGRAVGEGGRRPDECGLTAPTSTPWLFRRRNHSPQAELGDIRTCGILMWSPCSLHRRCSRSWRGCSRSCRCSSSQAPRHRPSLRRRERVGGNRFMRRCTRLYRPVFYYLGFWWVSLAVLSAVLPEHVYELWPGSQSNCCGFSAPTFWSSRPCHCWPASRPPADWSPRWLAPTRSSLVSTRSGSTSRAAPHLAT